mmetsp:Transcript_65479/g.151999  ORF Transcript_65479/g.151999 Transcript_65479/m.151999 type:complete len:299 (-) Transcript_65479:2429-3325(-)
MWNITSSHVVQEAGCLPLYHWQRRIKHLQDLATADAVDLCTLSDQRGQTPERTKALSSTVWDIQALCQDSRCIQVRQPPYNLIRVTLCVPGVHHPPDLVVAERAGIDAKVCHKKERFLASLAGVVSASVVPNHVEFVPYPGFLKFVFPCVQEELCSVRGRNDAEHMPPSVQLWSLQLIPHFLALFVFGCQRPCPISLGRFAIQVDLRDTLSRGTTCLKEDFVDPVLLWVEWPIEPARHREVLFIWSRSLIQPSVLAPRCILKRAQWRCRGQDSRHEPRLQPIRMKRYTRALDELNAPG